MKTLRSKFLLPLLIASLWLAGGSSVTLVASDIAQTAANVLSSNGLQGASSGTAGSGLL